MKAGLVCPYSRDGPGGVQEHIVAVSGGSLLGQLFSVVPAARFSESTPSPKESWRVNDP